MTTLSDLEAMQRDLDALRQEVDTRARRMRIFGAVILAAGLALLAVAALVLASPTEPTRDLEYHDVVTAASL